ncbi:SLC13 family permease [Clostridium magnum]|uniref:Sodium-dependent dicarboxylate transporter SdcS n=1 Tax=Clostridium magnum DSM 2767 TaxID=1121326 RepID=A0A161YJL4_9CLOT|nr:SLC13 family permease [Clostridium magnum]KZL90652.1 sodium-dependent dicarboxylate transporter SdcS [Clostridium magnum DSM 2767]SHI38601.1 anion transporter [Clostridium magnum DSM 2767]
MSQNTIAIIILVITMIMVMIDRIPLAATAMFAALAMSVMGIQSLGKAYSYFGSSTVVFCGATMIICNGLFQTGAIQKITNVLFSGLAQKNERWLVAAFSLFTGLVTGFTSNTAIAATLVPVACSISQSSNGKVKAKHLLMPVGTMSTIGSPLSLSGAAAVAAGGAMVIEAGTKMSYFEMAPIALVLIVISTLYFATIGYDIMKKSFDFEDPEIEVSTTKEDSEIPKWKPLFTVVVFVAVVIGFIANVWDVAVCSLMGVLVLWISGAVSVKESLKACDWNVLIVMAGVTSMANGLDKSGAGVVIANSIIGLFGGDAASPFVIMIALGLIGWLLSQFMSNTAANAIVVPVAISMGLALNVNLLYFCVPVIVGTSIAITTPLASPTTVIVMQGGFRFKDFVKVGVPLSILLLIAMFVMIPFGFAA